MQPDHPDEASTSSPPQVGELDKEPAPTPPPDEATAGAQEPAVAPEPSKLPVVGIGASAGGLEALEALIRRLSPNGMAFIVLQHLAPGHESLLPEILSRATAMKVVGIRDGIRVTPNTIFVAPPNADVALRDGALHISTPTGAYPRHTIDALLRTLAAELGTAAIGIVLSGAGSDGTLGLRAIKEEGGITFAQEPSTASQPGMPQSAIEAGVADFCLSPAEIGDELVRLGAHPFVAVRRPPRLFSEDELTRLFNRLRRSYDVDFTGYKRSTIERRIARRMALQKLERFDDYVTLLEASPDEQGLLYSDLLIGVSGFFRDREPFDALKAVVFPRLLEHRSLDVPIRLWVAGCASGEEAYSVAMCLLEYLGAAAGGRKIQIFATDIDNQALDRARAGIYPQSIEVDVEPGRLQRFFARHEKGYQVARHVRDLIVFARHNLGKDPPFSRLDLVTCRNVLIYMQPPLQRRVLRVFHYALNPEAFLMLGASESVGEASDMFSLLDRKQKIYVKKNVPSIAAFDFGLGPRAEKGEGRAEVPTLEHRPVVSMQQLADRKVIERYGPPGVLLNEDLEVIQFRGQTGPFLAPAPGVATFHVLKLVRAELLMELRDALRTASSDGLPVTTSPIRLSGNGPAVELDVMPLQDAAAHRKCLLVSFREAAPTPTPAEPAPGAAERSPRDARILELERELMVTKEYLQTTVQELEAANEELQSSNEELQSSNEELQSSNEELETSKEELQSANEEFATVNEELQNRMGQLAISNDDLQNLLSTVSSAVVIVGMDLRIRRFTCAAERLLNLVPADVGRPLGYLGGVVHAAHIEQVVGDAINEVSTREQRVRCADGLWYTMQVAPYRTSDHAIHGAIIELLRAPPVRRLGEPAEVHEFVGKVLSTLPNTLLLLDDQLRIIWANKQFFDTFQVGAEVLGHPLEAIWAVRETNPDLWSRLETTAAGGEAFQGVQVMHPLGRPEDRPMTLSAHRIPGEGDRPALILVTLQESASAP